MYFARSLCASALVSCLSLVAADSPLMGHSVRTVNLPGMTTAETLQEVRRGLAEAKLTKRADEFKGNTTLDRYWEGATLLKISASSTGVTVGKRQNTDPKASPGTASTSLGIEITCKKCYTKGIATYELEIADNFNATQAVNSTVIAVKDEVMNFTESVKDYFVNYTKGVVSKLGDGIDADDFIFPTFNYSFALDFPEIPQCTLHFTFDEMELYLELGTVFTLGTEYEINLFTAPTPAGIGLGPNLMIGTIFSIDLIFSVTGTIDMNSGIHIKLEDGIKIDLPLFSEKISNIEHNGGQFEFLPVTVESTGVVFGAMLRIGIHTGLSIGKPTTAGLASVLNVVPDIEAGIQASVFANLAEFTTNVTYVPNDPECEVQVVQEYQLAIGAKAGMSVGIGIVTYGPVAETSTPIWNTQLASVCAIKGTPAVSSPASVAASSTPTPTAKATTTTKGGNEKRQEMETTVLTSKTVHTAVYCATSMKANCPVSLQQTTQSTETLSLTTTFPSGGPEPTFPNATQTTIPATVPFGTNVNKIEKTSGSPTVFTPTPTSEAGKNKDDGGSGMSKAAIAGIVVGVLALVVAAVIVGVIMWKRKKNYNSVPKHKFDDGRGFVAETTYGGGGGAGANNGRFEPYKPQGNMNVREIGVGR